MAYMKTSDILSKVCTPKEILQIKTDIENVTGKNVKRLRRNRHDEELNEFEVQFTNDFDWKKIKVPQKRYR